MIEKSSSTLTSARWCSTPMACLFSPSSNWSTKLDRCRLNNQQRACSCVWTYWRYLNPSLPTLSSTSTWTTKGFQAQSLSHGVEPIPSTNTTRRISTTSNRLLSNSRWGRHLSSIEFKKKRNVSYNRNRKTTQSMSRKAFFAASAENHSRNSKSRVARWTCSWPKDASTGSMFLASSSMRRPRCNKPKKLVAMWFLEMLNV